MESGYIDSLNNYNGYFYIMPKKTNINNYDSLFIQVFEKNSGSIEFKLYKNFEIFLIFSCSSYEYYNISEINTENQLMLYAEHKNNFTFRYILYNSKIGEYANYNYITNLITTNTFTFKILDKNFFPYKIEIKPSPHEINGCSNYYFYILEPNFEIDNINYYNFKRLNSSIFSQNFTIENICSANGEFDSNDLKKFIFNSTIKTDKNIKIFGYSEQINHFKAIKFYPINEFYYEYDGKGNSNTELIIIIASSSVGFIIIIILIVVFVKRRKSNKHSKGDNIPNINYEIGENNENDENVLINENEINSNEMIVMNEYENNPNEYINNPINYEDNNLPYYDEAYDQNQS